MTDKTKKEMVVHPDHYGGKDNPYEIIKIVEALGFGFHLGNALKYMARAGKKPGSDPVQDLKKGKFYLDRFIEEFEKGNLDLNGMTLE